MKVVPKFSVEQNTDVIDVDNTVIEVGDELFIPVLPGTSMTVTRQHSSNSIVSIASTLSTDSNGPDMDEVILHLRRTRVNSGQDSAPDTSSYTQANFW
jgi:hypothetical protein